MPRQLALAASRAHTAARALLAGRRDDHHPGDPDRLHRQVRAACDPKPGGAKADRCVSVAGPHTADSVPRMRRTRRRATDFGFVVVGMSVLLLVVVNVLALRHFRAGESAVDAGGGVYIDNQRVAATRPTRTRDSHTSPTDRPRGAVRAHKTRPANKPTTPAVVAVQRTPVAVPAPQPPAARARVSPPEWSSETTSPTAVPTRPATPAPEPQTSPTRAPPPPPQPPASFDNKGTTPQTDSAPVSFDESGPGSAAQP
jgi:hypothetical protein